jgi:hypothetical protein
MHLLHNLRLFGYFPFFWFLCLVLDKNKIGALGFGLQVSVVWTHPVSIQKELDRRCKSQKVLENVHFLRVCIFLISGATNFCVLLDIFCDSLHAKLVGLSRSSCAEV